jgi:glucosamine 6-phosphate synthetase-like amidotransferase/phosphosugar isomerase protein
LPGWGGFTAHEKSDANNLLVVHNGVLRRFSVSHYLGQRGAAVERKIDATQEVVGLTENFAEPHVYLLQGPEEALALPQ